MKTMTLLCVLLLVGTAGCLGGEKRSEWAFEKTQLAGAYKDGHRGAGVTIAVIDTGVNLGHPSLNHLDDGDAPQLIAFRDFLDGSTGIENAKDDNGHGSHVLGILAARGSNFGGKLANGGVDLLGAAPDANFIVARVCDNDGCDASQVGPAVDWARQQGADVISLSLGGEGGIRLLGLAPSDALDAAIQRAVNVGIVVVAAAGNDGADADDVAYPSRLPEVISVGAIRSDGSVADFSNRGDAAANRGGLLGQGRGTPNQKPEVVAPGELIISAWTGKDYIRASGTSQATPFVAAVVALMIAGKTMDDAGDVERVKRVLMETAQKIDGQSTPHDPAAGYGLVQAQFAIAAYK